ncbi:MAG: hypothetical protein Q7S37_04870 [bacterium]|nr:hypothetical protein [bacterium]
MSKTGREDLPGADLLFGSHGKQTEDKPSVEEPEERGIRSGSNFKIAKLEETDPVKFTFYFNPQILEDLEVAKFRLRMERRLKISKSDIVNAALSYCMKDLTFLERLVSGKLD